MTNGNGVFDPKAYGAVGDGVTDDSAAFVAWNAAMRATSVSGMPSAHFVTRAQGYIPPGRYLITTPEALLTTAAGITNGWVVEGAGRQLTTIEFRPPTPGALMKNNDQYRHLRFEGITFVGGNSNATCVDSISQGGGASNYHFQNCEFMGTWADGIRLAGDAEADNNSEWLFTKCSIKGTYTRAFFTCGDGGANQMQDQFVNYDFVGCEVYLTSGGFINMIYGGAVRVLGGTLQMQGAGTLFTLGNPIHYSGCTSLHVEGQRVELRGATSKLIDCVWKNGNITFDTCMFNATAVASSTIIASFDGSGDCGPIVTWDNCRMAGKQEYKFGSNTWMAQPGRAIYRNCYIPYEHMQDSIVNTPVGATDALGGMWLIDFDRCRGASTYGSSGSLPGYEVVGNWQRRRGGEVVPHYRSIKTHNGTLPNSGVNGNADTWLPLNATILSVWFFLPAGVAGAYTSGGWSYTLKTTEESPTTIASLTDAVNGQDIGFNVRTVLAAPFVCDSDAKRKLTLIAKANGSPNYTTGLCVVEFLPGS